MSGKLVEKAPPGYYSAYMNQSEVWPSFSKDQRVRIADMASAHAINAYQVLRDVYWDNWVLNRRLPLPKALLHQAVGEPVVFEEDVAQAQREQYTLEHITRQGVRRACYDALVHLAEEDTNLHIIDKAEVLVDYLVSQLDLPV